MEKILVTFIFKVLKWVSPGTSAVLKDALHLSQESAYTHHCSIIEYEQYREDIDESLRAEHLERLHDEGPDSETENILQLLANA